MIVSRFLHSFLGHPLMALCHLFGACAAGSWCHDHLFPHPAPPPASPDTSPSQEVTTP